MTDADLRRFVSSGWAFHAAHNDNAAMREFKSALAIDPEHLNALAGLAQCQLNVRNFADALATSAAMLRIAPNDASAHRIKADALRRQGHRKQALEAAREAVKLAPRDPIGYHFVAVILYDMKRYKAALATVREGRALAPNYAVLMAQEALIVFEMKGGKAAGPLIDEALRQGLDSDYVAVLAARIALARDQIERARDLLRGILQNNANDEEAISLYLLTDRDRYRLLRAHFQFPYWRREHGAIGWIAWVTFWVVLILILGALAVATHAPGIALALIYRWIVHSQYQAHRAEVRKHFAAFALKGGY